MRPPGRDRGARGTRNVRVARVLLQGTSLQPFQVGYTDNADSASRSIDNGGCQITMCTITPSSPFELYRIKLEKWILFVVVPM